MAVSTIKCPECGGDRTIASGANRYTCQYCGASFVNAAEIVNKPKPATTTCPICGGEISPGAQKCRHCGEWLVQRQNIYSSLPPQSQYIQQGTPVIHSSKSKVVAALLAFFLGGLGIHEFYLGRNGAGVFFLLATLLTSWFVFPLIIIGIICLIQCISYLCMSDEQFAAKYH